MTWYRWFAAVLFLALATHATVSPASAQTRSIRIATIRPRRRRKSTMQEMGFFAKAGLDVKITPSQSGAAIASAVASNAVDIGWTPPVSLAIAHVKHVPFVIVAPAALYASSAALIHVHPGSEELGRVYVAELASTPARVPLRKHWIVLKRSSRAPGKAGQRTLTPIISGANARHPVPGVPTWRGDGCISSRGAGRCDRDDRCGQLRRLVAPFSPLPAPGHATRAD